jgi:hypothetical protein
MSERMFPIQSERGAKPHPIRIPWSVAEKAFSVYSARYGRDQSLERMAERGGFGPGEMDLFLPGWRDEVAEITSLRAALAAVTKERDEAATWAKELDERLAASNEETQHVFNAMRAAEAAPAAAEGSEEPEPGGCSRCGLHRDRAIHWNRESPLFHEFSPTGRSPGPAPRGTP